MRWEHSKRTVVLWAAIVLCAALIAVTYGGLLREPGQERDVRSRQSRDNSKKHPPLAEILPEICDAVVVAKFVEFMRNPEAYPWACSLQAEGPRLSLLRVVSGECDAKEFHFRGPRVVWGDDNVGREITIYLRKSPIKRNGFRVLHTEPYIGSDAPGYREYLICSKQDPLQDFTFEDYLDFYDWYRLKSDTNPDMPAVWKSNTKEKLKKLIAEWRKSR